MIFCQYPEIKVSMMTDDFLFFMIIIAYKTFICYRCVERFCHAGFSSPRGPVFCAPTIYPFLLSTPNKPLNFFVVIFQARSENFVFRGKRLAECFSFDQSQILSSSTFTNFCYVTWFNKKGSKENDNFPPYLLRLSRHFFIV